MKVLFTLIVAFVAPMPAFAHRMDITATADAANIRVVAGFEGPDQQAAAGATVTVLDGNRVEVARGVTDDSGVCVLPRPVAGTYRIVVDDNQGHVAKVDLMIRDEEATAAKTQTMNRWAMAGLGMGLIAGMSWVLRKWGHGKQVSKQNESPPNTNNPGSV